MHVQIEVEQPRNALLPSEALKQQDIFSEDSLDADQSIGLSIFAQAMPPLKVGAGLVPARIADRR